MCSEEVSGICSPRVWSSVERRIAMESMMADIGVPWERVEGVRLDSLEQAERLSPGMVGRGFCLQVEPTEVGTIGLYIAVAGFFERLCARTLPCSLRRFLAAGGAATEARGLSEGKQGMMRRKQTTRCSAPVCRD